MFGARSLDGRQRFVFMENPNPPSLRHEIIRILYQDNTVHELPGGGGRVYVDCERVALTKEQMADKIVELILGRDEKKYAEK